MKNTTEKRREAIKELIAQKQVLDQQHLVKLLDTLCKIKTNQTVVSRDLRHLGVVKKQVKGVIVYELEQTDTRKELLKLAIENIEHNNALIVIKTHPALADFVGDCIDQLKETSILGTLSGENTVFVTPRVLKEIESVYVILCKKLYFKTLK